MKTLAGVARKHPQSAYTGLKKSLQQEWAFVQRVAHGIIDAFGPVEEALQENFLSDLFQGLRERAPRRGFTRLPVKQSGLVLPDPTKTAPANWTASCVISGHLITSLRGQEEFQTADHSDCLQEGRTVVRKWSALMVEEALPVTISGYPVQGARRMQQAKKTGKWQMVQLSTVNRTGLGERESRDALFLRYGLETLDLPRYCKRLKRHLFYMSRT